MTPNTPAPAPQAELAARREADATPERAWLRSACTPEPDAALATLQRQALVDWHQACAAPPRAHRLQPVLAVAHHPWWSSGVLVLALLLGAWWAFQTQNNNGFEDLQHPDVLSQMGLGQL
jgi:hypothetical protein